MLEALQDAMRVKDMAAGEQDGKVALGVVVVGRDLAADGTLDSLEHRVPFLNLARGDAHALVCVSRNRRRHDLYVL